MKTDVDTKCENLVANLTQQRRTLVSSIKGITTAIAFAEPAVNSENVEVTVDAISNITAATTLGAYTDVVPCIHNGDGAKIIGAELGRKGREKGGICFDESLIN